MPPVGRTFGATTGQLNPNPKWPFWISSPFTQQIPSAPEAAPDFSFMGVIRQTGRRFPALQRRGKLWNADLTQTVAAAATDWPAEATIVPHRYHSLLRGKVRKPLEFPMAGGDALYGLWKSDTISPNKRVNFNKRGRFLVFPFIDTWKPGITTKRRQWNFNKRGKILGFPTTGADIFFGLWKPDTVSRRRRWNFTKRGKILAFPTAGADISFGLWKPDTVSRKKRWNFTKRGKILGFPIAGADVYFGLWKPAISQRRRFTLSIRRGKVIDASAAYQAVAPPPVSTWTPQTISRRRFFAARRQGRVPAIPLVGAALNAFVFVPKQIPKSSKFGILQRRGKRADAPITQATTPLAVWPPMPISRRRLYLLGRRLRGRQMPVQQASAPSISRARVRYQAKPRGKRFERVHMQAYGISTIRATRRPVAAVRRGKKLEFPYFIPPIIPKFVPALTRPRVRYAGVFRRRGKFFFTPVKGVIQILRPGFDVLRSASAPDGILSNALETGVSVLRKAREITGTLRKVSDVDAELRDASEPDESKIRKADG